MNVCLITEISLPQSRKSSTKNKIRMGFFMAISAVKNSRMVPPGATILLKEPEDICLRALRGTREGKQRRQTFDDETVLKLWKS